MRSAGTLRLPDRCRCADGADRGAHQQPADNELSEAVCGGLDSESNDGQNESDEDGPQPADPLAVSDAEERADHCAEIVTAGHDTCKGGMRTRPNGTCFAGLRQYSPRTRAFWAC